MTADDSGNPGERPREIQPSNGVTVNGTAKWRTNGPVMESVPIAVCGMALRLPGGLSSPQELWEFLLAKGDARARVPASRYNISSYYSASGERGTVATEFGYFLDDEKVKLGALDASRFSFSRAELLAADPQQRLMLEVARECLDDAGEGARFRGRDIGCYMGCYGEDWLEIQSRDPQQSGTFKVDGYNDFMLSNRVSYEMDLRGPSMTVRTACSSALVGLHEACLAMQRGDCEAAIVGGANLIMAPGLTTFMSEKGMLSPEGSCKTFSADADGYARGEAVSAVFLKPLAAALRDGNPIRAVIRGTMTNSDGKTQGITLPSPQSQAAMMRKAYEAAGITDISKTAFVEAHGTGTPTGDPLEAQAIAAVFGGDKGVFIGSVKPNLGHSEGASGITSLIKAVLSLENQTIPPNIKFLKPSPKIGFQEHNLIVPTEATPWPESRHERVSVNSFGLGGTNAHVIVDSARSFLRVVSDSTAVTATEDSSGDRPCLLVVSANSASSLRKMTQELQDWTNKASPGDLKHLAYTLGNRREHLAHRSFMVAPADKAVVAAPSRRIPTPSPKIVMVFTGQGAQWPQMGRELLLRSDLPFQASIQTLDKCLQACPKPPSWSLEGELLKPAKTSAVHMAEMSQPLCTAVQIALVDLFASIGVEPYAVIGHSSGEVAAAYAAGTLTAKEAIIAAWQRGVFAKKQNRPGAMAAVGLGWDDVRPFLGPKVVVACENSPKSVTLSGDAPEVEAAVLCIREEYPHVMARLLKVDKAYHSWHMKEIGEEYRATVARDVVDRVPQKPFFSSVTGKLWPKGTPIGAEYWQQNLQSPVLFRSAVSAILDTVKDAAFLEIGPHAALAGPLRQNQADASSSLPYASAMTRGEDCVESLLTAVGNLFQLNVPVDFSALMPTGRVLPGLPTYAWDHEADYWRESRMAREWRDRKFPSHPLLGVRQLESTSLEPSWRNLLQVDDRCAGWLRDHKIEESIIFPCAGYLAMVGEAVRQAGQHQDGFTIRNMVIGAALVLQDETPTELVTNFRPHRLTESLDSAWWDFTISSYNGHLWTKHCEGEITCASSSQLTAEAQDTAWLLPRKVTQQRFYRAMCEAGLTFGPRFQRLRDLRTSAVEGIAVAEISKVGMGDEEHYHLHPTIVDACLQSAALAAFRGRLDSKNYRRVPTRIERLTMRSCAPDVDMRVTASATVSPGSGEVASRVQQIISGENGEVVFHMEGLKLSPLEATKTASEEETNNGLPTTARAEWGPHIDFLDAAKLIRPSIPRHLYTETMNELNRLCLVYSDRHIKHLQPTPELPHLQKYKTWIHDAAQAIGDGMKAHSDQAILDKIADIVKSLSDTPMVGCGEAMQKVARNISGILSGQVEALAILMAEDTLTKVYIATDACDRSDFLRHLAHSKPNLRILEVGAGTGASTMSILKHLSRPLGGGREAPLYSKYTFTDVSPAFSVAARELFAQRPNVDYRVLDISKDPEEQGFDPRGDRYDLVIATNVIHTTGSLRESLRHVRKLLAPGGRLLLHELFSPSKWTNFVFGTLPGWWYGGEDGRVWEPYVSPDRWDRELRAAGFAGLDSVALDAEEPHQLNAIMLARPGKEKDRTTGTKKGVTLLTGLGPPGEGEEGFGLVNTLERQLQDQGFAVQRCLLGALDELPAAQDIICLADLEQPFFEDMDAARYEVFQDLISRLDSSRGMLWVTRPSQLQCRDPRYAQVVGTARAIRNELLVDLATCEVDTSEASFGRVADVFAHFQGREDVEEEEAALQPEYEYAIINDQVHVGRIYPFSLPCSMVSDRMDRAQLEKTKPGRLSSFQWTARAAKPVAGDDVEVEIYAAGLNYRDVSCALGTVLFPEEGLGLEASGVVRRVGPGVKHLQVGDRVVFLGRGAFSTHVVIRERYCEKLPKGLSFEDATSLPSVFMTAAASLFNCGRLQKGQSVLIHSACGGVGLAAIQLAAMVGAEIYATVGTEEKVKYLIDTVGLPANRIFSSRDLSFVAGMMRETEGKGVDLVLNSLSGELLHATWQCVAEFGTMVEIGKRDILGRGRLDMEQFLTCRTYTGFDLDEFNRKKPEACKELLQSVMGYLEKGHIKPIRPIKSFQSSSIESAFRYMQQGVHMGKILISMRESADGRVNLDDAALVKPMKELQLDGDDSYLLVGGFGGLGHAVARHMVEHGARRLVFLSRSAGTGPDDADLVRELESMGCEFCIVRGSVTNADDVARAVRQADPARLRGMLQLSMVLRDEAFPQMKLDDWTAVVGPKTRGTWLLHQAALAAGLELDFFVLFSSLSGVLGQPGQANYAGSNTFLDAFVQYRHSLGLPASSVDIGVVMDIGAAALDKATMQRMKAASVHSVIEPELLEAISAAMLDGTTTTATEDHDDAGIFHKHTFMVGLGTTIPLSHPENRAFFRRDRRLAIYHNNTGTASPKADGSSSSGSTGEGLQAFISRVRAAGDGAGALLESEETAGFLAREIARKLFAFLLRDAEDLDASVTTPLSQLGMDSLVGVEMRNWWRQAFGFSITVLELMGLGNADALGRHAAEGLRKLLG